MIPAPGVSRLPPWTVYEFDSVVSTNATVREIPRAPGEWIAVRAEYQTAGRGRHGRTWQAPTGANLLVTFAPAENDVACLDVVALAAANAVCRALASSGLTARPKWPNDVLVADAKLAGVLIEREGEALYIGIGLNVNWPSQRLAAESELPWTSVAAEAGVASTPRELLPSVAAALAESLRCPPAIVVREFRERLWLPETPVRVYLHGRWCMASIVDITSAGALCVRTSGGDEGIVESSAHMRLP